MKKPLTYLVEWHNPFIKLPKSQEDILFTDEYDNLQIGIYYKKLFHVIPHDLVSSAPTYKKEQIGYWSYIEMPPSPTAHKYDRS